MEFVPESLPNGGECSILLAGQIDFEVLMCYNLVTLCVLEFSKYDRIY